MTTKKNDQRMKPFKKPAVPFKQAQRTAKILKVVKTRFSGKTKE